jgi:UDP-glucose 4-epimerase
MRILITGGAGFIGSNLVDATMAGGHEVTVLDDLSAGRVAHIASHLHDSRFRFVNASILNCGVLESLVRDSELIYHLAARVGVRYIVDDPLSGIVTNVRGTENVLALAARYWVRTVIASSSEVYGKSEDVPLHEDSDRVLGPTTVGRWSYSSSKAIDEYVAFAYAGQGLPISIVRYFNSYGPRLDGRGYGSVVAKFLTQALAGQPLTVYDDGEQTRCYTYVSDTVEGTIRAATMPEAAGNVFNIGSNREVSVNKLAHMIQKLTGDISEIEYIRSASAYGPDFEETRRRVPDVSRARDILGFEASVSLEEGLDRTLQWFRAQGMGDK